MTRWEYKIHWLSEDWDRRVEYDVQAHKFRAFRIKIWDELGADGWELIKIDYGETGVSTVWKRELQ